MFSRVITTEILKLGAPVPASRSSALMAVAKEPGPRIASFTAADTPSSEIWTSM